MSAKWSENVMMKFLELYQTQECLWNYRISDYKNREARENALRCIVKGMELSGLTTSDLKNKIKTIRTMYSKEHALVCKSKKSGMGTDELYVPKLFWYKRADLFLNGVTNTRNTSSNLNYEEESQTMENVLETQDENQPCTSTSAAITPKNARLQKNVACLETSESDNSKHAKTPKSIFRAPQDRKRKLSGNENISNISAAIDKLDEVVQRNRSTEDEFDIFAKHIAVQLRQMPLYDAIICQEEIQGVIRQKRLQLLKGQSQGYTVLSSGFSSGFSTSECKSSPSPALSQSQYHSSPSPALSNSMEDIYWSPPASVSNEEQGGEDSQESASSHILVEALRGVLN